MSMYGSAVKESMQKDLLEAINELGKTDVFEGRCGCDCYVDGYQDAIQHVKKIVEQYDISSW